MKVAVEERRTLLADLPGDATVNPRHDYRYAPVTDARSIPKHPWVALSLDLRSVEARVDELSKNGAVSEDDWD